MCFSLPTLVGNGPAFRFENLRIYFWNLIFQKMQTIRVKYNKHENMKCFWADLSGVLAAHDVFYLKYQFLNSTNEQLLMQAGNIIANWSLCVLLWCCLCGLRSNKQYSILTDTDTPRYPFYLFCIYQHLNFHSLDYMYLIWMWCCLQLEWIESLSSGSIAWITICNWNR